MTSVRWRPPLFPVAREPGFLRLQAGKERNHDGGVSNESSRVRWWTWAGARANATLVAALNVTAPEALAEDQSYGNEYVNHRGDATLRQVIHALSQFSSAEAELPKPEPNKIALQRLKFSDLLPPHMGLATLGERLGDPVGVHKLIGGDVQP